MCSISILALITVYHHCLQWQVMLLCSQFLLFSHVCYGGWSPFCCLIDVGLGLWEGTTSQCYGLNYVPPFICWCPNPLVPQNVTELGDSAFKEVIKLKEVTRVIKLNKITKLIWLVPYYDIYKPRREASPILPIPWSWTSSFQNWDNQFCYLSCPVCDTLSQQP